MPSAAWEIRYQPLKRRLLLTQLSYKGDHLGPGIGIEPIASGLRNRRTTISADPANIRLLVW